MQKDSSIRRWKDAFQSLTGDSPLPWQEAAYERFVAGDFPESCVIPTGLGKTSIMAIWLLALAKRAEASAMAGFPRRLIYVVNRRTVVDQATAVAERLRTALDEQALASVKAALANTCLNADESPLAISTLRGQFADNREWLQDPSRPAIIVGTVDMIGSRLLFSGYRCSYKARPLHAGLLGQDSLLVHDEAHLEPAFQDLISAIRREQLRCSEFRPLRVLEMTATSRTDFSRDAQSATTPLELTPADYDHPVVRARIHARKGLAITELDDPGKFVDAVVERALAFEGSGKAVLIYAREVGNVEKIANRLRQRVKPPQAVVSLTGTMRGYERDSLLNDPYFQRFLYGSDSGETGYLVATSAGEVGINITADVLICDLTPFDSMGQRFGRVNRFGGGDARIEVLYAKPRAREDKSVEQDEDAASPPQQGRLAQYQIACARTLDALRALPVRDDGLLDASPHALANLPAALKQPGYSPLPEIPALTDVLLDTWSLTTIRGALPGRPPVADWLHGKAEWEPPRTSIAWREEVGRITGDLLKVHSVDSLLDDYPLKPHELLEDVTSRVVGHLIAISKRVAGLPVWVRSASDGDPVRQLDELLNRKRDEVEAILANATVILPPRAGGLSAGMMDGASEYDPEAAYDVADSLTDANDRPLRVRIFGDIDPPAGMRLIRSIELPVENEEDEDDIQVWRWYERTRFAEDVGSRISIHEQTLPDHHTFSDNYAKELCDRLRFDDYEREAICKAASMHDSGKARYVWQASIGQIGGGVPLAKARKLDPAVLNHFRHEMGSVLDIAATLGNDESRELILHLIAAHHGRARPFFPVIEVFDPEVPRNIVLAEAMRIPGRFARLQRRYGRWGLAYLESVVHAADVLGSQVQPILAEVAT